MINLMIKLKKTTLLSKTNNKISHCIINFSKMLMRINRNKKTINILNNKRIKVNRNSKKKTYNNNINNLEMLIISKLMKNNRNNTQAKTLKFKRYCKKMTKIVIKKSKFKVMTTTVNKKSKISGISKKVYNLTVNLVLKSENSCTACQITQCQCNDVYWIDTLEESIHQERSEIYQCGHLFFFTFIFMPFRPKPRFSSAGGLAFSIVFSPGLLRFSYSSLLRFLF